MSDGFEAPPDADRIWIFRCIGIGIGIGIRIRLIVFRFGVRRIITFGSYLHE
jgi:hypothetical protein